MCEEYFRGNIDAARKLQLQHTGLINALFSDVNPIPVKEAMNMLGLSVGPCRLPLYPMAEAAKENLKNKLIECGLMP